MKIYHYCILLIISMPTIVNATDLSGHYKTEITVLNYLNNEPLREYNLTINDDVVQTDSFGKATINVSWRIPEKINFESNKDFKYAVEIFNPKYLRISSGSQFLFVKNKWKEFGYKQWNLPNQLTYRITVYMWP